MAVSAASDCVCGATYRDEQLGTRLFARKWPRPNPCSTTRMIIRSYRDLAVWQKSMGLARDIEQLTARLPAQQRYALAPQLRRASSSIPFNIAEGWARPTKVYIHHLLIALGSEAELQTELMHTANLNCIAHSDIEELLERPSEIGRMLRGLVRSLRIHLAKQEH